MMTTIQESYVKRASFQQQMAQLINESGLTPFELHTILTGYITEVAQILQNEERQAIQMYNQELAAQPQTKTEEVEVEEETEIETETAEVETETEETVSEA